MTFINAHWDSIQPTVPQGNSGAECVAKSFLYPWNHDNANMDMICRAIKTLNPKVVIELGTFEGFGTEKMAHAMSAGSKLYTFDAGEAPVDCLGETYGVTKEFKYKKWMVDWKNITFPGWDSFGEVIDKRTERVNADYGGVKVTLIEGMTFDTLPKQMPKIGKWDFLFQDTLHYLDFIIKEWKLVKKYSKKGSVIVFDDVSLKTGGQDTIDYFETNEKTWQWRHTPIGHGQLWGEKQ
jgi:predicted O-methyltransferase YrrM